MDKAKQNRQFLNILCFVFVRKGKSTLTLCIILILFPIFFSCKKIQDDYIPNEVVRLVLESKELLEYLHPEVEGRIPVLLEDNLINSSFQLRMFGKNVKIISGGDSLTKPFIKFTNFEIDGNKATVKFEYPIEGVLGKYYFSRTKDDGWELIDSRILEK